MNNENEILVKLENLTDEDFSDYVGIQDWTRRYLSYSKILNEHSRLAYDGNGMFQIDLLEITYFSDYNHLFFKAPFVYQDYLFKSRYRIDSEINLVQIMVNNAGYHQQYNIEFMGITLGRLFLHKTSDILLSKIQVNNELLYSYSPACIIISLVEVAKRFGLRFKNYSGYEIAYDSQHNYYEDICRFIYKTDFCDYYVHEIAGTVPEFTFHGKRRKFHHEINKTDSKRGTVTIGSKRNSPSYVKIYPKTQEAFENGKQYIIDLHKSIFGNSETVYRVEVHANSEMFNGTTAFSKGEYDLIDLLNYQNLKTNFCMMLGNKLKFRSIKATGYDKGRNPIYEKVNLLKFTTEIQYSNVRQRRTGRESTEFHSVSKFKEIIYNYLDDDVNFQTVLRYVFNREIENYSQLRSGLEMAMRNYKHPVNSAKRKRIEHLAVYLTKPNKRLKGTMGAIYFDIWSWIS